MTTELYILLKVKSRKRLGFLEWLWLKLHKEPSRNKSDETLDRLWMGKFIAEEPWEIDEQGCELIPSLPDKRFFLTNRGKKKLRRLKWTYPWKVACKLMSSLIWIIQKIWWLIAAAVICELVNSLFPDLLQDVKSWLLS